MRALPVLVLAATALLAAQESSARCCFTNPQYTGTCRVVPSQGETCASILDYLNDARSQGKNYCGSTTVRGGWKLVTCETEPKGS
jgi:hypothetical protein